MVPEVCPRITNWRESGAPVSSEQLTTDHGQPTKMTFLKEPALSLVSIYGSQHSSAEPSRMTNNEQTYENH